MPDATVDSLLKPHKLLSRSDVLGKPSAVRGRPGLYAWYFDAVPGDIPTSGLHQSDHGVLLYVGISPGAPPANGKPPSTQNLYKRVRYHFTGNAAGSTLRLTLGCHLSDELGIELRRVGSGERLTFTPAGEQKLSAWMGIHARVAVFEHPRPWEAEPELIATAGVPLNIDHNRDHPYYLVNRAMRADHKARARASAIWTADVS